MKSTFVGYRDSVRLRMSVMDLRRSLIFAILEVYSPVLLPEEEPLEYQEWGAAS